MEETIHPLVDYHLRNWARWMRHPELGIGYPSHSAVFCTGGVSGAEGFEHFAEGEDHKAVLIINRIIDDLEEDESSAINYVYLSATYKLRDIEGSFSKAIGKIWRGMIKDGLA